MYEAFYNLKMMPFENTPDPRFFFQSEQHREALAAIEYTIRMRKGFVLITGDIGSGKTTVGRAMCERVGHAATIVNITHSHRDGDSLIRQTLRALNIRTQRGEDHGRMLERLGSYLLDRINQARPVVLFVDEAQTLSDDALEELRLMSTFDTSTQKAIQIVLVGQPELRQHIANTRRLAALRQRIVLAKHLRPLDMQDVVRYVEHRIRIAGNDPTTPAPGVRFEAGAFNRIHQTTHGIPRLINVICDNALLMAFVSETRSIGATIINRVIEDMVPNFGDDSDSGISNTPALGLTGTY